MRPIIKCDLPLLSPEMLERSVGKKLFQLLFRTEEMKYKVSIVADNAYYKENSCFLFLTQS